MVHELMTRQKGSPWCEEEIDDDCCEEEFGGGDVLVADVFEEVGVFLVSVWMEHLDGEFDDEFAESEELFATKGVVGLDSDDDSSCG